MGHEDELFKNDLRIGYQNLKTILKTRLVADPTLEGTFEPKAKQGWV
jgi:hypothetical protein